MAKRKGWEREPARHSLAARGHKTASVKTMKGMFNSADGSNVAVACRHCSSKLYPSAGKYTEDEIRESGLVKVRFKVPNEPPGDDVAERWAQEHYHMHWDDLGSKEMEEFYSEWNTFFDGAGESMWVKVDKVENGKVYGKLDNDPVLIDMELGDPVEVPTEAVVQVWDPEYERRLDKAREETEKEKRL